MSDNPSMVERYFPTQESRRRASTELIQKAEAILSKYDQDVVAEVRRRRETGESFRQIFEAMGRNPQVAAIGMQLAVIGQAHQIRRGG